MPIHLFIDTNVYLKFYDFSKEDLEELEKVKVLLANKELVLYVPNQTKDEFKRNREAKLAETIKKIKEANTSIPLPIFCKKYSEYDEITQLSKDINKQKEALLKKIISDIHNKKLKADEIIALLFEYGREIEITEEIIQNGKTRYDLGNPPGKKGSYGDALNWESLLKEACQPHLGDTYDLCFISDDKDYISAIDSDNFNSFLEEEWKEKKQTCIYFYKDLSSFFADKFSEEKLAIDFERDILVKNFVNSSSFHNTRENLKRLYKLGN